MLSVASAFSLLQLTSVTPDLTFLVVSVGGSHQSCVGMFRNGSELSFVTKHHQHGTYPATISYRILYKESYAIRRDSLERILWQRSNRVSYFPGVSALTEIAPIKEDSILTQFHRVSGPIPVSYDDESAVDQ